MAYPTGNLSVTLDEIDRILSNVKAYCLSCRNKSAAQDITSTNIFDVFSRLKSDRARLEVLRVAPGLGAYAQSQKNNASLNIATEFTAVLNAIDGVTAWITTNFPVSSTFLLAQTLGANGPVDRLFTTAATAGFRTALDSLIATIT